MKVQLEKTFSVSSAPDAAWTFLQNVEAVTGCMPGAEITERIDDNHYKGTVSVKMGPAKMAFRGDVEVQDVDPSARSLRLIGKGMDTTGTSGASMDLLARIDAREDGSCELVGLSEVSMSGKAASFGARMMNSVADTLMAQFADNFAAQVTATSPEEREAARPAKELNALAFAWAVFTNWLRRLFSKKKA
jgi:carbon monoxide dehydrogenase subunit G